MKVYSILGNSQRLDGGAMFGNAPRALWERWLTPDDRHRVPLACRAMLVTGLEGKNVLFETGIGAFFDPQLRDRYGVVESDHVLLESLAAVGLTHDQIDVVVLSHLHFDHAGGLLRAYDPKNGPELLFPKATFVVGADAWARAADPHPRDRASFIPELIELLAASGRLETVAGDRSTTLGTAVRFHRSDGHTPGMLLAEVGDVIFLADLVPGVPWVHVPITMGYDRFPERLIDEKQTMLADLHKRGVRLFFTHDPETALATLDCDPRGRYRAVDLLPAADGVELPDSRPAVSVDS